MLALVLSQIAGSLLIALLLEGSGQVASNLSELALDLNVGTYLTTIEGRSPKKENCPLYPFKDGRKLKPATAAVATLPGRGAGDCQGPAQISLRL